MVQSSFVTLTHHKKYNMTKKKRKRDESINTKASVTYKVENNEKQNIAEYIILLEGGLTAVMAS